MSRCIVVEFDDHNGAIEFGRMLGELVRCQDCKNRDDDYVCYKWASIDECPKVRPNDFCSYGEREGE